VPLIADDGAAQSRAGVADLSDAERELRDAAIAGRLLDLDLIARRQPPGAGAFASPRAHHWAP
jgi:hypothetical protein